MNESMPSLKRQLDRGAGILMPVSALPAKYGIGTLGKESLRFIDFLKYAGFKYWQVLPVGPTSYGDSPYQSFSAFAGNPYFIDLEYLAEERLLTAKEADTYKWQYNEASIDYALLYNSRFRILRKAFERSRHKTEASFRQFCDRNGYWLEGYCFFMAFKYHFGGREWLSWEEDIKLRRPEAMEEYCGRLKEDIEFWKFCQYKFREQWDRVKKYANDRGILIIGDIPLYSAMDSADAWEHADLFELDERKQPVHVAGVPPDAFSEEGQRWGNPLYRWDRMEQEDFSWWRERMKVSASLYDVVRIDHFIGIVNYYSIPAENPTAAGGRWIKGPGRKLTDIIDASVGDAKIIAEDLGVLTPEVKELIREAGYPGMKVLLFGLDGPADNTYLPHNYTTSNLIAYTGTHDNETLAGFLKGKTKGQKKHLCGYFNTGRPKQLPDAIIKALYACVADVVMLPMQDLLKLGSKARMNFPSTIRNNWKWRMKNKQYKKLSTKKLYALARLYGRAPERPARR